MTKRASKKIIRRQEQLSRGGTIMAKLLSGKLDIQYTTDSKGREVRVTTAENPVTREDVRRALLNTRVVEESDMLREVGQNAWDYLVKEGHVRKDPVSSYYWVTTKAQERYALPMPYLPGVGSVRFQKAA